MGDAALKRVSMEDALRLVGVVRAEDVLSEHDQRVFAEGRLIAAGRRLDDVRRRVRAL